MTDKPGSLRSTRTVSAVSELIAMSPLCLRSSSARVVASGITLNPHALQFRWRLPITRVTLDHDFLVLLGADEAERPRADGILVEIFTAVVRHDPDRTIREVPEQRRHGLLEMEDNAGIVGRVDVVDLVVRRNFRTADLDRKSTRLN